MKTGKTILILIFMSLAIFAMAKAGLLAGESQSVSEKDNIYTNPEKTIRCDVDKIFSIVLDSNPSTGYKWRLAQSSDWEFLKLVNTKYRDSKTELAGAGGHEIWSFKALSVGQGVIVFEYARPWETNKTPAKSVTFIVNVQKADPEKPEREKGP